MTMNVSIDTYYTEHPKCSPTLSANRHVLTALYVQSFPSTYITPGFWVGRNLSDSHLGASHEKKRKGSRGTSQNLLYPLTFTWGPLIKAYKGGNIDKKKSIYIHFLRELRQQKSFRKYIPLFGVLLNMYPCFKRSRSCCVCVCVRMYAYVWVEMENVPKLPNFLH